MRGEVKVTNSLNNFLKRVELVEKRHGLIVRQVDYLMKQLEIMDDEIANITACEQRLTDEVLDFQLKADEYVETKIRHAKYAMDSENRRLTRELKKALKDVDVLSSRIQVDSLREQKKDDVERDYNLGRAGTIAIFDSIIAAIGNWSNDGQVAPDFELLLQSILFPLVYEPVMRGDSDYYLYQVPVSALEVVKRGREYVKDFRQQKDVAIDADSDMWAICSATLKEWVTNDALPLLYGAGSPDWPAVKSIEIDNMWKWKNEPASRALEFPLIFDSIDLMAMMADDIRESTGLPEFNKQTLFTRIDP